jgi:peptidoglycan DL-endopeptidase CwlO
MRLSRRARTGAVVAALAVIAVPCADAAAAQVAPPVVPVAVPAAAPVVPVAVPAAPPVLPVGSTSAPTPSPTPSVPTDAEVKKAKDAAAAAAKEVAAINAQVKAAEARLETLQREVADSVAAQEQAAQQLADAEKSVVRATAALAAARAARDHADRSLSGTAAELYMHGGDLQDLTTLVLAPPGVMSDLVVVIDHNAHRVRDDLDAATSAAQDAATQERLLVSARNARDAAAQDATAQVAAAKKKAQRAGAEAARLATKQEELAARLVTLQQSAATLVSQREAAARLATTELVGVQAAKGAPRDAQLIASSKLASYGWDATQLPCLVKLWNGESGWSWSAANTSSGAYGIPQALPGWKMASAGSDWLTNPATQIAWGMGYIKSVYGSPCAAYDTWLTRSPHWY